MSKYIRLVTLMAFAFGVGFQFPVLLVFLQLVGVLTPQQLLGAWRYAIVGIVVLAAVITPSGDPISLAALAGPMLVLYFIAAGIGLFAQRRCRRPRAGRRDVVRRPVNEHESRRSSPTIRSSSTASSARRSTPSTPAGTSWSPPRPEAARRSSPSTASRRCAGAAGGPSTPRR